MMKLLIAEDDSIILKGLVHNTDWASCGISSIETATDGEIALEKLETFSADILITDINMPFMDGLELTKKAKELYPDLIVIILTGYDTFDYAKKALQLGVLDYLMKPVLPKDLKACIDKATQLVAEKRKTANLMEKGTELLRTNFLERLFLHGYDESIHENLKRFNIEIKEGPYIAAIARIEDYENGLGFSLDSEEMSFKLLEYCEDNLCSKGIAWLHNGEYIHMIIQSEVAERFLSSLVSYASNSAGTSLVVSVGQDAISINNISESATEALDLQRNLGIFTHGAIISKDSLKDLAIDQDAISDLIKHLEFSIQEGKNEDCLLILSSLIASSSAESLPGNLILTIFHICNVVKTLIEQNIIKESDYNSDSLLMEFYSIKTVKLQEEYLKQLLDDLCNIISDSASSDPINTKIIDYLSRNYKDPMISLTTLADYMEMSPVYLCSIFKKKNGVSFSQYLTELRFTKACQLLQATTLKNYEISSEVGITNAQYFCSRFKKMYGCTPQEYRESN